MGQFLQGAIFMNSMQINYFLKAAEHLNFSAAAKELFVSQPAVSKQIVSLEEELGFKLFDRARKNRLVLTPAGRVFRDVFIKMQADMNDAVKTAEQLISRHEGVLRIGMVEGWDMKSFISDCTDHFEKYCPGIRLEFETHTFMKLHAGLEANTFDVIACVETGFSNLENVNVKKIARIPAVIIFSSRHRLAGAKDLKPSSFKDDIFYVLPENEAPLSRDINKSYCLSEGFVPKMEEKPNRDSILLAISNGKGYAIFDAWTRYKDHKDFCGLETNALIPICTSWKKSNTNPFIGVFNERFMQWANTAV
jgi:DNA-binding transcriptional LysR family regulator